MKPSYIRYDARKIAPRLFLKGALRIAHALADEDQRVYYVFKRSGLWHIMNGMEFVESDNVFFRRIIVIPS